MIATWELYDSPTSFCDRNPINVTEVIKAQVSFYFFKKTGKTLIGGKKRIEETVW